MLFFGLTKRKIIEKQPKTIKLIGLPRERQEKVLFKLPRIRLSSGLACKLLVCETSLNLREPTNSLI